MLQWLKFSTSHCNLMQLWILYNVTTRLHFSPNKAGISGLPSTAKHSWSFVAGGLGDNLLSTKEARNRWETEVSNTVITPQLKVKKFFWLYVFCKRRLSKMFHLMCKYYTLSSAIVPVTALGSTAEGSQRVHPGRLSHLRQSSCEALVWWPSSFLGLTPSNVSDP